MSEPQVVATSKTIVKIAPLIEALLSCTFGNDEPTHIRVSATTRKHLYKYLAEMQRARPIEERWVPEGWCFDKFSVQGAEVVTVWDVPEGYAHVIDIKNLNEPSRQAMAKIVFWEYD
jgi:hypothetical protein